MIKVYLVDDHKIYLEGLSLLLKLSKKIDIVGIAYNGCTVLNECNSEQIDVFVIDMYLPDYTGIELISDIRKINPKAKILVLTCENDADLYKKCIALEVNGYCLKHEGTNNILKAITDIYNGFEYFTEITNSVTKKTVSKYCNLCLTKREKEIVKLISEGYTNTAIAKKLNIGIQTVNTHRNNAISKVNARNSQELISIALRNGLID